MLRRCCAASAPPVAARWRCSSLQFVLLGVLACAAGVVLALAGQELLVRTLAAIMDAGLPAPTWPPALAAFATGLLLLFGFALPPLVALASVPPLRVLRRDLPRPQAAGVLAYALGVATVAMLIAWQAREAQAGAIMVGGVAALLLVSAFVAWALISLLKRLPQRGVSWRFGLANLSRRRFASSLQIGALALGLMALLLLTRGARRPDARLAREPAAGCAQPVPRQRAAGPGGRCARDAVAAVSGARSPSGRWCAAVSWR